MCNCDNYRIRRLIKIIWLITVGLFALVRVTLGQSVVGDYRSVATGNWAIAATWQICTVAGSPGTWAAAAVAPAAANNVTIQAGHTITINSTGACKNLTIFGTTNWTAGRTITVNGNLILSGGTLNGTITGTLNVSGSFLVPAGSTANIGRVTTNITGTSTIDGALSITNTNGTKTFKSAVTISSTGSWTNTANESFTFQNGLTVNGSLISGTGTYTFNTNNQTIGGTTAVSIYALTVTGVTLTNNNTLSVTNSLSGTGGLTQANNATLNIGNGSAITTLTATAIGNTVNYNRIGTQTVKSTNYYNLSLSGTLAKTLPAATMTVANNFTLNGTATATTRATVNINGNLIIGDGTTFTAAGFPITVLGTTTIGSGTSGILRISSATGAKIFTGLVTINAGAIWNNSGNSPITFRGGITNNNTFTAGTGVQTFDTNSQALTGTFTIPNVTVAGVTLTNNNSLTTATALAGSGTLSQASNAALNIGTSAANLTLTGLTATASGNTVNYYAAAAQTVKPTTYLNLTLSGSGAKTTTSATINGILSMEGTATTAGSIATYGANATLQYKGSAAQVPGIEFPSVFGGSGGVIINNASGVNLASSVGITNTLTLNSGLLTVGAYTLTLNGPSIAGTPTNLTTSAASSLVFGGNSSSVQLPSSITALNNLTLNNSNGITLNSSPILAGTLTLTSGVLTTGANTIQAATVSRSSGWVNGKLKLPVATGANVSKTFDIGDASLYTPVTVLFASVSTTGYLTVNTTSGQHPSIATSGVNYSKDVNRYYTIANTSTVFTSYSPTFNFTSSDIIGSASYSNFVVKEYNAGWASTTIGTKGATSTQATGINTFGDFAIGEAQSLDHFTLILADPQTNGISFINTNTLTACDISGNTITAFNASTDNVTLAANAPLTTGTGAISGLSGTYKLTNAADFVSGVANLTSLGLKYTGVGATGTFKATSASGKTGTSGNVTIEIGYLSITTISSPQTAGVGFDITVTALDANDNPVNVTTNSLITLSLASGTGALGGTLTGTITAGSNSTTISGVTYNKAESGVKITATQTTGTPLITTGNSNSFTIVAGLPTRLAISTISTQTAATGFSVIVTSIDANGNAANVTSSTGISLSKATGTGTLSGTLNGTIANGANTVTINGVKYNIAENGVSITSTQTSGTPSLTNGTSNTFAVIPDATQSTLTPGTANVTANGINTQLLTVQAKDANGVNLTTGGATVTITKLSGTGTIGAVTDNNNGTYTASVTSPILVGNGVFVATLNGNPVKSGTGSQTQSTVTYIPGAADATHSTLTPNSASIADDGVASQVLTVQAIDANGNNITTGGASVSISLLSGDGSISSVTDNGNGTYTATVTSTTDGSGTFVASIGGNPVKSNTASQTTSTITYLLGVENAAASTLTPIFSNILADGSSTQVLEVQAKDATGNDISVGGATVVITKQGGTKGSIGTVTDNGDGTYTATVTSVNTAGTNGIFTATLNGNPVKNGTGSQTLATITYGSSPDQSTLTPLTASISGGGLDAIDLTVQAKDIYGNDVTTGGETVTITKSAGTGTISAVTDNGDGTYTATVTSGASPGSGTFVATINGSSVKNGTASQTQAVITYAGAANADHSTFTPTSASIIANGTSTQTLTVQAKDINNNNLTTGGSVVTITQLSGTGTISSVTDNDDGTYTATVTSPTTTGNGLFVATLGGIGNPVRSGGAFQTSATINYIPGPADGTKTTITPTSATIASCGITQVLTVQAKDFYGNNLTTGGSIVIFTRQSGVGSISAVTDNNNGTYSATVTSPSPTTTSSGVFIATLGGNPIQSGSGSQTQVTINFTPGMTANISGGTTPICYNTSPGMLTASGAAGVGTYTYLWYANGASTGVTTNTYTPVNVTANTTYYCAVTSGSCGTVNTSSTTINITPLPTAAISGTQGICPGYSTSPISINLTGTQPWNLTYTDGTTPVVVNGITSSPYIFTVSPASTVTYTVTSLTDANCSAQSANMTGSAIITVYQKPKPGSIYRISNF